MRKEKLSTEERIRRSEKKKIFDQEKESAEIKALNDTFFAKIRNPIRWLLYLEIFVSVSTFFFFPFRTKETVLFYHYETRTYKGTPIYSRIIRTESEKELLLTSVTKKDLKIAKNDTIFVLRNLFYKTEAVTKANCEHVYYTSQKLIWCFVWIFALPTAIASSFFKTARDIKIRNRLTLGLALITLLYFLV
jgi:hypothetical protein